jgi:glycosyltransferase involved in cell wall biosynthesis
MHVMLAREWLMRGFGVDFVLLQKIGDLLEIVPVGAHVFDLGVKRFRDAISPLRVYIGENKPEVVLAAMWPLTVVAVIATKLAGTGGARTVVSDHSILSRSYQHRGAAHRAFLRASMALTYRLADARVAVSKGVAADVAALSGIRRDQFRVIYNPAATGKKNLDAKFVPPELENIRGPLILTVGTLKAVKDYTLLINAFSLLPQQSDATLCILGEGALRGELEQLVTQLGLQGRVLLPGFRVDTSSWYRRADLFVLSSKHEGFGNVIVEALEYGVPVVSTDCPTGPREILFDGMYGRLVPVGDVAALSESMLVALSETPDREALKARARDFSVDKIATEYLGVMFPNRIPGTS